MPGTQMPKVHGPSKGVKPKHKPETKPIPVVPKSEPQPQTVVLPSSPSQERRGKRRNKRQDYWT